MCVTCGSVGQPSEPSRSTMYVPISAVKNMISVPRNSHIPSLELGMGRPILSGGAECEGAWASACDINSSVSVQQSKMVPSQNGQQHRQVNQRAQHELPGPL